MIGYPLSINRHHVFSCSAPSHAASIPSARPVDGYGACHLARPRVVLFPLLGKKYLYPHLSLSTIPLTPRQGVSFYPQLLSNIKRRSVTGLALDYFVFNVIGFACYTISCIAFLFSPVVRKEYADRHPDSPEPTVRGNDLAFAAHALAISIITLSQFWAGLWGYERHPAQKMSKPAKAFVAGCFVVVGINCAYVDGVKWGWIDVVSASVSMRLLALFCPRL